MRVEAVNDRFTNRKFKVKDERHSVQMPDQSRGIDRQQNRGQARRAERETFKQQPLKVDGRSAQPQAQGERVGNRTHQPDFSRPRQPEVDKKSRVLVPRSEQPRMRQNSENPGRVRSAEAKVEKKQQKPAPTNPQSSGKGKGKSKGPKP
jgi:hypothetical protein